MIVKMMLFMDFTLIDTHDTAKLNLFKGEPSKKGNLGVVPKSETLLLTYIWDFGPTNGQDYGQMKVKSLQMITLRIFNQLAMTKSNVGDDCYDDNIKENLHR